MLRVCAYAINKVDKLLVINTCQGLTIEVSDGYDE